jgi:hypothetical protein
LIGCNSAADEQHKATQAEQQANEEIAELTRKAQDKAAEVRAEADKQIAEAQADFMKLRENFRHETAEHLLELDRKIATLEAEVATLKGTAKAELDAKLVAIRAQRQQFAQDFQAIADDSAATWDATKRRLEKSWSDLEKSVDRAN